MTRRRANENGLRGRIDDDAKIAAFVRARVEAGDADAATAAATSARFKLAPPLSPSSVTRWRARQVDRILARAAGASDDDDDLMDRDPAAWLAKAYGETEADEMAAERWPMAHHLDELFEALEAMPSKDARRLPLNLRKALDVLTEVWTAKRPKARRRAS
ncbi:MAG: hypothetical protein HYV09_15205 [Deltaproteobacteria bacterium]|nr:hypothetical protein [Deltaproteobacteria bacterium]